MKNFLKKFTFPYKTTILISSTLILVLPFIIFSIIIPAHVSTLHKSDFQIFRLALFSSTFLAMLGFIYCTLGYHFQILRGDELKLRIHLESLNAAFTTTLVAFFILIFVFINFSPKMLNWILLILSVILICSYLLATQFIRDKYQ